MYSSKGKVVWWGCEARRRNGFEKRRWNKAKEQENYSPFGVTRLLLEEECCCYYCCWCCCCCCCCCHRRRRRRRVAGCLAYVLPCREYVSMQMQVIMRTGVSSVGSSVSPSICGDTYDVRRTSGCLQDPRDGSVGIWKRSH